MQKTLTLTLMINISFPQLLFKKCGDGVRDSLKVLVAFLLRSLEAARDVPLDERHGHGI